LRAAERDPVDAGLAICALFRGEDTDEARIGGMIIAEMAIGIRRALGGNRVELRAPPEADEEIG
jgi:hypothetical protein